MSGETILALILGFKYLALFVLVIVEGFFTTIAAGALAAREVLNLPAVIAVVILADLTSDYLYFTFGKRISRSRFAKFLSLAPTQIHRVERIFTRHGRGATIIVAKLSSYLAIPVIVGAGAVHMPKRTFYGCCAIAAVLKSCILVALGYYFGKEIHHLVNLVIVVSAAVTLAALGYAVGSHYLQASRRDT
jgi:membrane protein DedA with SNARE-associated domain